MSDAHLFEDSFTLSSIIDDSYDRVARLQATNTDSTIALTLDYNTELFPLERGQSVNVLFASTLNLDGTKVDLSRGWQPRRPGAEQTLADLWDYVCYGKVYRHEEMGEGGNM
nr:dna-directed rna polymerases i, ii, and iii subunit rpabc3 [Quercus suber]